MSTSSLSSFPERPRAQPQPSQIVFKGWLARPRSCCFMGRWKYLHIIYLRIHQVSGVFTHLALNSLKAVWKTFTLGNKALLTLWSGQETFPWSWIVNYIPAATPGAMEVANLLFVWFTGGDFNGEASHGHLLVSWMVSIQPHDVVQMLN